MYLGDKLNLLYHALYVQGIFAHLFFFIYHTYFMQNIECIYRFDSKWNSVCPEPLYVNLMLYIASSTISTSGGFGMKMPLLSLLSEL